MVSACVTARGPTRVRTPPVSQAGGEFEAWASVYCDSSSTIFMSTGRNLQVTSRSRYVLVLPRGEVQTLVTMT
jgi:hypothetical protein